MLFVDLVKIDSTIKLSISRRKGMGMEWTGRVLWAMRMRKRLGYGKEHD